MQSKPETKAPNPPILAHATNEAFVVSDEDKIVTLCFNWEEYQFNTLLERESVKQSRLRISCDLGTVPFSAEGVQRRLNIFAVLAATKTGLQVRTEVSRKQRIRMIAEAKLDAPVSTNTLITGIVTLLLQARPYLDLIKMMQQPVGSVGFRQ